jgi:hypothetical protein
LASATAPTDRATARAETAMSLAKMSLLVLIAGAGLSVDHREEHEGPIWTAFHRHETIAAEASPPCNGE